MADEKLGVAFSGGGIRSAAYCSGVLRRLIDKNKEPDYLSCVSGGCYTGSAYVQWKYHWKQRPDANQNQSTDEFFDHMRENISLYCDCNCGCNLKKCMRCLGDCCSFSVLLLFVVPTLIAGWLSFAFPIAFIVSVVYGPLLDGTLCVEKAGSVDCQHRKILFLASIGFFVLFHVIEYFVSCCCENKKNYSETKCQIIKPLLKLFQLLSGSSFALTFLPWFTNDFLQYITLWERLIIVGVTVLLWFFVPILRKYCSLGILIYFYSYVVYWRVYKGELFYIKYTEERYQTGMIGSLIIIAVFSVLGDFPLRLVHIYNRWRLQKAFYYEDVDSSGKGSVKEEQCCYCYDIFPGGHCPKCCCPSCRCPPTDLDQPEDGKTDTKKRKIKKALTLADLADIKPHYISSVVVNGWRREYERKYCLLTMSPEGISVIDKQPTSTAVQIEDKPLKPSDIKLSSAMAMSAAAVSPYAGKNENMERLCTHFFTMFGIEMGANIVYDMTGERKNDCCGQFCFYTANIIVCVMWLCSLVVMLKEKSDRITFGSLIAIVVIFLLAFLFSLRSKKLQSWCIVHLPIYRFIRSMLHLITYGEAPPAMLHISDGGHFENYGLLPLLKLRLPKILLVHGLEIKSDEDYARDIIVGMEHARRIFNCSFTSMAGNDVLDAIEEKYGRDVLDHIKHLRGGEDVLKYIKTQLGGDVLTDMRNEFVAKRSRKYEFKVYYPKDDKNEMPASVGHIVLVAPRRPGEDTSGDSDNQGDNMNMSQRNPGAKNWNEFGSGAMNPKKRDETPYLTDEDIKTVEGSPKDENRMRRSEEHAGFIAQRRPGEGTSGGWGSQEVNMNMSQRNPGAKNWNEIRNGAMDTKKWGETPYLTDEHIKTIEGCPKGIGCCECCHSCGKCSNSCLIKFPRHPTLNQFFTPSMFAVYHREGYRACMECDVWLSHI